MCQSVDAINATRQCQGGIFFAPAAMVAHDNDVTIEKELSDIFQKWEAVVSRVTREAGLVSQSSRALPMSPSCTWRPKLSVGSGQPGTGMAGQEPSFVLERTVILAQ